MKRLLLAVGLPLLVVAIASRRTEPAGEPGWKLTQESEALVSNSKLRGQIFRALTEAEKAGTDPAISRYQVRAATVVEKNGDEHVVLGGNTEYSVPEAIHGETSMLNHVTALYGAEATKRLVKFVAFFSVRCGGGGSCGDCRDYQMQATDYQHLLIVCGQSSDHTVRVTRFADQLVDEGKFPEVQPSALPVSGVELGQLVQAAEQARLGGVTLFTGSHHSGAAALSYSGKIYRAAGADDAAFHYRYPIGGVLQQAATERDYLLRAILVVGEKGHWPVVMYRDRQYGYESSSFNHEYGKLPITLILADGLGHYRATTFEAALPNAFSTASFMPQAVKDFLKSHQPATN